MELLAVKTLRPSRLTRTVRRWLAERIDQVPPVPHPSLDTHPLPAFPPPLPQGILGPEDLRAFGFLPIFRVSGSSAQRFGAEQPLNVAECYTDAEPWTPPPLHTDLNGA